MSLISWWMWIHNYSCNCVSEKHFCTWWLCRIMHMEHGRGQNSRARRAFLWHPWAILKWVRSIWCRNVCICMYVFMYVRVCIYIYIYIYMYIHIYTCRYVHIHTHTRTHTPQWTCTAQCRCPCQLTCSTLRMYMYVYTWTHTHTHTHTHIYIYTHIHARAHIHTGGHTQASVNLLAGSRAQGVSDGFRTYWAWLS
jgi:hypothetical protein